MPEFGSSFLGLANDRILTSEELIRAIRFMVAAEYESTQLYIQLTTTSQVPPQSVSIKSHSYRVETVNR